MEIFHIGEGERKLVSIFYAGDERKAKRTGIIICNPLGHEYIRFYKTIAVLAKELSQQGFPVFRFDYYGTGDSYGDDTGLDVNSSKEDLKQVANEMREGCDIDQLCLIGIRYGSLLSMVSLEDIKVDKLVLWNPVFSGKDFVEEIASNDREFFQGSFALNQKHSAHEYFGIEYSDKLISSLNAFHITSLRPKPLRQVLLLADQELLANHPPAGFNFFNQTTLTIMENSVPRFWLKQKGEEDKSLVPLHEIKKIAEWLVASH